MSNRTAPRLASFDASDYLDNEETIAEYLAVASEIRLVNGGAAGQVCWLSPNRCTALKCRA